MQLKSIQETLLPHLLKNNFAAEIFKNLDHKKLSVKGFAGSAHSLFTAELFLTQKKNIFFLVDDKEEALYITTELEELLGKENVLYFPQTHLDPYQIEKTQNANLVLRTEVLNKILTEKSPKVIISPMLAIAEKVIKKEDFSAISHTLKVGDKLDFDFVDELLNHYQFQPTDFVSEPGEFSGEINNSAGF
jgi:transcription-repair coupling factor (superfamily II helicase)